MYEWTRMTLAATAACTTSLMAGCLEEIDAVDDPGIFVTASEQAIGSATVASAPSVVADGQDRLDIFFTNYAYQLVRRTWIAPGPWTGDIVHDGLQELVIGPPSCVRAREGIIDCVVYHGDGYLRSMEYDIATGTETWTALWNIGVDGSAPSAAVLKGGHIDIFYRDGGWLHHARKSPGASWTPVYPPTGLGYSSGIPSCASISENTWGCALLDHSGGTVHYYAGTTHDDGYMGGPSDAITMQREIGGSHDIAPSVFARGDAAYLELFHEEASSSDIVQRYLDEDGDDEPIATYEPGTSASRGTLATMPRCIQWGQGSMICIAKDSDSRLRYSLYYHDTTTPYWFDWATF